LKLKFVLAIVAVIAIVSGSILYFVVSESLPSTLAEGEQVGVQSFSAPVCTNSPSAYTCLSNRNYTAPSNSSLDATQWSPLSYSQYDGQNVPLTNWTFYGIETATLVKTQSFFLVNGTQESNTTSYSLYVNVEGL
jgi:hypothetical protein